MKIRSFAAAIAALSMSVSAGAQVNLEDSQVPYQQLAKDEKKHVLDKRWFEKLDITGFAAAGYYKTEANGLLPYGHFTVKEASLFFESEVAEDMAFFLEWQAIRLKDEDKKVAGQTAEAYLHLKNVLKAQGDDLLGIKLGRFDLPYGEEYLFQDAIDNPLISLSVSWPYGWDEGILFYGTAHNVGWVLSLTDGHDDRSTDDHPSLAYNGKIYGDLAPNLYGSLSYMHNGRTSESAMEFAGTHLTSPAGTTAQTESSMWEANLKYSIPSSWHLWVNYGSVQAKDKANPTANRNFSYYTVEPLYHLNDNLFLVARYSAIGTFKSDKGYNFDGKPYAKGDQYGYNTSSLSRSSLGIGHKLNTNSILKAEYARHDFNAIDGATQPVDKKHDFYGVELAVKF